MSDLEILDCDPVATHPTGHAHTYRNVSTKTSADGTRLAKVGADRIATTYYAGEMVYSKNSSLIYSLAYILHPEGMFITGSKYQYYLKDHLNFTPDRFAKPVRSFCVDK
jgi:hypothetical protein